MSGEQASITTVAQLREAVLLLKAQQTSEGELLREHFMMTYETMRPVNLIKSAFNEVTESQELKEHVLSSVVGLAVGHASKKVFESVSDSPAKELFGTAIQFGVTNAVARHPEVVIAAAKGLFHLIRSAWSSSESEEETEDSESDTD